MTNPIRQGDITGFDDVEVFILEDTTMTELYTITYFIALLAITTWLYSNWRVKKHEQEKHMEAFNYDW